MTYIKKLEVKGFKSIGPGTTVLNFEPSFVAITGANGSGKSNIMDAVLFCLGQNSPKMLRVDRLTSLIHEVGPEREKAPFTRVSLTFDNTDRSIPVDADQVTVTRELSRTGENTYVLNGKKTPRGVLLDLLDLALISAEGINIVPQGMVTRISDLSPDEKRHLIEEVVGVSRFDEKKVEAQRQLQDADVRLQVALARIGEMKSRVEGLEAERNDQLRLRRLEAEIRKARAVLVAQRLHEVRKRSSETQRSIHALAREVEALRSRLEEVEANMAASEAEKSSFVTSVMDGAGAKQAELALALARVITEIRTLEATKVEADRKVERIEAELPSLRKGLVAKSAEAEQARQELRGFEDQLKSLEDSKRMHEQSMVLLQEERTKRARALARAKESIGPLNLRLERAMEMARAISEKTEALTARLQIDTERRKALEEKGNSFVETLKGLENSLSELRRMKQGEIDALGRVDRFMASLSGRQEKLEDEVSRAVATLERANISFIRFESQRAVAEEAVAEELSLRKIDELAGAGALEGYRGRLENLVSFDVKFELAVRAVGGRWFRAVVVDDMKALLKVAEVAKRLKLGRLRIIPLSEVAGSRGVPTLPLPGALGSLSSYLRAGEEMTGVVNFIFGDAILADSPRAAYTISLRGVRAVTVNGDVFEPEARALETGFISRLEKVLDLLGDEGSLAPIKEALSSLNRIIERRKGDLSRLEQQVRRFDREKIQRGLTVKRLAAEERSITSFISKYAKIRRSLVRKVAQIRSKIEMGEKRLRNFARTHSTLTQKIGGYRAKLEGIRLKELTSELDGAEQKITGLAGEIEKVNLGMRELGMKVAIERARLEHELEVSMKSLNDRVERDEAEYAEAGKSLEIASKRIGELEREKDELEKEQVELLRRSRSARPILEEQDRKLRSMKERAEGLRREINGRERENLNLMRLSESLEEMGARHMQEMKGYGFDSPPDVFDGADFLLKRLEGEHGELRESVNLLAERSYAEVFRGYKDLSVRRNQLERERDAIVKFVESVETEKRKVFLASFYRIDRELRSTFGGLTEGSGWLELEDPDDIFSKGVFLMTQFKGKTPRESSTVSGGEKTVCALALILAIQGVYPSPFYFLDEIDAHLDVVNCERLGDLLGERAERSQIVIISLRDSIVSKASLILGAYMAEGRSHFLKYRPGIEVTVPSE